GASVHTVSEHVAAEVREHYRLPDARVVPIPLGVDPDAPAGDAVAGRHLSGFERYVLALGTIEPRKNLPSLVRAFDRIAEKHAGLGLVVAGPPGWGVEAFRDAVGAARHPHQVRELGYVDDVARADLLAGADALAYPSLDEGFGHPPFEAMAAGVPVVAARSG